MAHGYERCFVSRDFEKSEEKSNRALEAALKKSGYSSQVYGNFVQITLWEYEWWASMIGHSSEGNYAPVPLPREEEIKSWENAAQKAGIVFDPESRWMLDYETR